MKTDPLRSLNNLKIYLGSLSSVKEINRGQIKKVYEDSPGEPVVKAPAPTAWGVGSNHLIQGTRIPHTEHGLKKKKVI